MKHNNKYVLFSIIALILLIGIVFVGNYFDGKQKEETVSSDNLWDFEDVNNVSVVDAKLTGDDYRITQSYLFNYTKYKSSTWYKGSAYVEKIAKKEDLALITLKDNKNSTVSIVATIDVKNANVKTGDVVNFVGTIDIAKEEINLSKISKDSINYSNTEETTIEDLINNVKLIKRTYFIVNGYMVTDGDKYKLYDTKEDYKKHADAKRYFTVQWADEFGYTGNQDVTLRCLIVDTYVLGSCELKK